MKNYKKVSIALLAIAALAVGLVLAGCSETWEGSYASKTVKLTLTDTTYKVEYDGKVGEGNATKTSAGGASVWTFTSGGTGGFTTPSNVLAYVGSGWSVTSTMTKKSVAEDGVFYVDPADIEVIIIEE